MITEISGLIQYVYICARTKSRNVIFLILSVLHQRQNIFYLNLTYKVDFRVDVMPYTSMSFCAIVKFCSCFVEGEDLGELKG